MILDIAIFFVWSIAHTTTFVLLFYELSAIYVNKFSFVPKSRVLLIKLHIMVFLGINLIFIGCALSLSIYKTLRMQRM